MQEDVKSSPLMSPTQVAKARARGNMQRGAPVIQSGPAPVPLNQPPPPQQRGPAGVSMRELGGQPHQESPNRQSRSPEEIKADMQRLADGIKQHEVATKEAEAPPPPEVKEDETSDDLREWLTSPSTEDLFNNTRYKKLVESRLEKMEVESLIMHGEVIQFVPILMRKGSPQSRISATFRSVSAMEDLAIKKRFYEEEGPDRFMIDRYSLMNLCIGLKSLNGTDQQPHLDENGKFDDAAFKKKFEKLLKMPHQLLALLVVNYIWFDERVRKLLVADELGNG